MRPEPRNRLTLNSDLPNAAPSPSSRRSFLALACGGFGTAGALVAPARAQTAATRLASALARLESLGSEPDIHPWEELADIYTTCWPTMHRNAYDKERCHVSRQVCAHFDLPFIHRLLVVVRAGDGSDLLYAALDGPLSRRTSMGGMCALMMFDSHTLWLKKSILRCFSGFVYPIGFEDRMRTAFSLREFFKSDWPRRLLEPAEIQGWDAPLPRQRYS